MANANGAPSWTVTSQHERVEVGDSGQAERGIRVEFNTPSGAHGSVFVPSRLYTTEYVRQQIAARAAVLEEVAGLKG